MPIPTAEAVRVVAARLAGRTGTRWIGIDGFGAAGKTTLAQQLSRALGGAAVVHVDDFARIGLPDWDHERFRREVLQPLLAGRPARYTGWDLAANAATGWRVVPPGGPVIVEGVSATDLRVPVPWDLTLWLEVPAEQRWQRIVQRDGPDRLDRWLTDWLPSEEAYAAAQHPQDRADLVVDGTR